MREPGAAQSAYKVVDRLLALRDLLRNEPCTLRQISVCLPEHYADDESGGRKLRRDLQYLERWGYQVIRNRASKTYVLGKNRVEYDWTDEELTAMAALRESFRGAAPYAETIQTILQHIQEGLNEKAHKVFIHKPALQIELAIAEKRSPATALRRKLEEAVDKHQRISFKYCPLDQPRVVDHPDDEPLALEFRDGHYYLTAYCFKRNSICDYRLDQIVEGSMRILPDRAMGGWKREMVDFQYRLFPKLARRGVSVRFREIVAYEPQKDGSMIVTARDYGEFGIIREILRYGEQAEIVGPPALRAKMKRVVEQMCVLYSKDDGTASKD